MCPNFSQIFMNVPLFSLHSAFYACEDASEYAPFFHAIYVPGSLGIFDQALESFYSKCEKS